MAQQNRKSDEQKLWRNKAQREVDAYLDYLTVDADFESIMGEGRSMMGNIADFHGDLPKGSGFSGFCKLGAKVDRMKHRDIPERLKRAAGNLGKLSDRQRDALCVDRCFRGRTKVIATDPFRPESPVELLYTDAECARLLACSVQTFRQRVSDGYSRLEQVLGFVSEEKRAA